MTKKELIQELTERGISFDPSSSSRELERLLSESTASAPIPSSAVVSEEETKQPEQVEEEIDYGEAVDVIARGKIYVRTFSKTVHGKDYKKLAEQYANKQQYENRSLTLVDSSKIKEVEVRYREKEDGEKPFAKQNPNLPIVDKRKRFTDKEAALRFNVAKKGTVIACGL